MREFSLGRRRFALGAAAAAATALIVPSRGFTQQSTAPAEKQDVSSPPAGSLEEQAKIAMAKLSPQARAEAEMKMAEIVRKYGDRLSDEQRTDIRRVLAETQNGLEKMRAFALDNSDQPAAVFQAYRVEGNK
jgi:hypothetical protein